MHGTAVSGSAKRSSGCTRGLLLHLRPGILGLGLAFVGVGKCETRGPSTCYNTVLYTALKACSARFGLCFGMLRLPILSTHHLPLTVRPFRLPCLRIAMKLVGQKWEPRRTIQDEASHSTPLRPLPKPFPKPSSTYNLSQQPENPSQEAGYMGCLAGIVPRCTAVVLGLRISASRHSRLLTYGYVSA